MSSITPAFAVAGLLLLGVAWAQGEENSSAAVLADGESFAGELRSVSPQWELTFQSGEETKTLGAAELVSWGVPREPRYGHLLLLSGGGSLVAEVLRTDGDVLTVRSPALGEVKLPLARVRGILPHLPSDAQRRDRLTGRVRNFAGREDRLLLTNGDELSGRLKAITVTDDIRDEMEVKFDTGAGVIGIPITGGQRRIEAVLLSAQLLSDPKPRGLHAMLGLNDGSRLLVDRLTLSGDQAVMQLPGNLRWEFTTGESPSSPGAITYLQPRGGSVVYLSDLKPASYRHVPLLSLAWPYRQDINVGGTALRCGGRVYLKGLGMHSASQLTYVFDQPYQRFEAHVALDDSIGNHGSVQFRVFTYYREDGQTKRKTAYTSPILRGGMKRVPVSIDLTNARGLSLVVDYAERGDVKDHANWLDARLVP